ncbi:Cullin family protein [Rutstroemia sp. NJR-2017a BVV2]|nr:Cullin family protein [Rutstroemia sp. NJR-2017a BVV2]
MAALTARKKRVFDSVFKKPEISEPTPVATPTGSFATLSQTQSPRPPSSGRRNAPQTRNTDRSSVDQIRDQVRWDRSWHTVTYYLNLPKISPDANPLDVLKLPSPPSSRSSFNDALKDVLTPRSRLPFALHTEDLLEWHTQLVRRHFLQHILPVLHRFSNEKSPKKLLLRTVAVLDAAQQLYHHGLSIVLEEVEFIQPGYTAIVVEKFRRDFHAIVSNSLMGKLTHPMRTALTQLISEVLGLLNGDGSDAVGISRADARTDEVCNELLDLIRILHKVGLAGEDFQVIFAEIMNRSMTEYVHRGCKGLWSSNETYDDVEANKKRNSMLPRTAHHVSPSRCVTELCGWIEERYSKLAVLVFKILDNAEITGSDREKWKEMSIGRLAALRIEELFDIVLSWPNNSEALHDLRTTITSPQRRLHLTEAFASTLKERLLHPGASTLLILQTYISMIWSFHSLDHSKVLLDRVAYPLQLYLCSREDTVRIVISGLLSETEDAQGNPIEPGGDKLIELAQLLNDESQQAGQKGNDDEMDWHDMDWVPDPVDAGPGYKRSKSADIIGTLIGVLGSQEVFIKEFQNIIGENLLKNEGSFEKEIKVLELLKTRFGEAPLQSCEVMLKDILDSVRVDQIIRKTQRLDSPSSAPSNADPTEPALHAKILSRLFWPQLQDTTYLIPPSIASLQSRYSTGFESLKASRKLTWLPTLGQTTVELELQDRTIVEEVLPWQATVIYAFNNDSDSDSNAEITKSVQELIDTLEMDRSLVLSALKFWTHKLVLHETAPDSGIYAVLETLDPSDRARSDAQATAAGAGAEDAPDAGAKDKGITGEHDVVYWQFIHSMLTNSSSQMALGQISMMLKMLIAEGFPYSNEELQEWLGRKVEEGKVECSAGKYKLKK